jgi:hypothetical protein
MVAGGASAGRIGGGAKAHDRGRQQGGCDEVFHIFSLSPLRSHRDGAGPGSIRIFDAPRTAGTSKHSRDLNEVI